MDIGYQVKEIVARQLSVDVGELRDDASFIDDLGADSPSLVELLLAFEDQFEVEILAEDAEELRTVDDAIRYIRDRARWYQRIAR